MDGEVKVAINYDRIADDSKWDGLKGYLTNTDIPIQDVYTAYHNLLTSSSCHPKALVKEFSYFLMPCHQHGLGVNLLVQR